MEKGPAIVKPTARLSQPVSEWGPSIRSDAPVTSDPHRAPLQNPPARAEQTTAANARRPYYGDTSTAPTPLHTGAPSPFVMRQIDKLHPETAEKLRGHIRHKTGGTSGR
jgi:hypothetical protein